MKATEQAKYDGRTSDLTLGWLTKRHGKAWESWREFAEASVFYDISPTTIQKWKKRLHSKTTRYIKPYKIEDEALAQDVKDHPDDYHYERAQRFDCSPTGISKALKRIGVSKKKDT